MGSCVSGSCMNGGACKEHVVGSTRFAYCFCQGGYKGPKCENSIYRYSILVKKYKNELIFLEAFTCPDVGKFPDLDMYNQGKYFDCKMQGSCKTIGNILFLFHV